jgi:hypothetical protein
MRGFGCRTTGLVGALACVAACGGSHGGDDDGSAWTGASGGIETGRGTGGSAVAGLGGWSVGASGGHPLSGAGGRGSGGAGAGGATGGRGIGGSAAGDDAGRSSGAGDSSSARGTGFVNVVSFSTPMIYLVPRFVEAGRVSTCTRQDFGDCSVYVCASDPVQTHPDAGLISVTVDGEPLLSSMPDANGVYPTTFLRDREFAGGELLSIRAEGGEVGAFDAMVEVPAGVLMSKPELGTDASGIAVVPRDEDLVIEWSGGTPDVIVNVQGGSALGSPVTTLSCYVASEAGGMTIPAEVLEIVAPVQLQALAFEEQSVVAGGYDVTVYGVLAVNATSGDPIVVGVE